MNIGYVKIYRSSLDDSLYFAEPFTKWQAWCDLLLLANFTDSEKFVRGIKVETKRGNVYMSSQELADRWKWSRGKVLRFLTYLEEDNRIVQQKSNVITSISILNYEKYQSNGTPNSTPNSTPNGTTIYNKKDNKEKKDNKPSNEGIVPAQRSEAIAKFEEWLKKNCPYIFGHFTLLKEEELSKLKLQYGSKAIAEMCEQIENRKDLRKNYTNLYRTLLNWLKRDNNGSNNRTDNSTAAEQRTIDAANTIAEFISRGDNAGAEDEDITGLWK